MWAHAGTVRSRITRPAICIAGWTVVFVLPDKYRATAKVYVETRTALSQVTTGISVENGVETQIDRVRQQILGGPALQRVGDETDLFSQLMEETPPLSPDVPPPRSGLFRRRR